MPQLAEEHRARLDGIVQQMVANGESDDAIHSVVSDFSQKYAAAPKQQATAPKEEKSVGGFLGNVMSSGGRFLADSAKGLYDTARFVGDVMPGADPSQMAARRQQVIDTVKNAPRIASVAGQALKNRYGGLEQIGNTLYNDPVGVLGDVSTLAGGIGLAGKAGGAAKIARIAEGISEATNPLRVLEPAAKAIEYGTAAAVRPMLKPAKGLRRQQDSLLEIERTALKEGAFTEGLAKSKQNAAAQRATDAAESATAAVPRESILQMPKSLEKVDRGLSHESDLNTLANLEADAGASLPESVSARQLLDKRRYLDRELNSAFRAAERGGAPTGIKQAGQQEMLGNIRGQLRSAAPDIRQADDATRRLGLVRSAIEDAGLRAGDIPMGAALLGGGLAAGGIPGAGVAGALFGAGRTFPQIPLAIGSVPVRASAALAGKGTRKGLLLAAMVDRLQGGGGQD